MVNPWEQPELKKVWKNKSAFYNWLRGNIRRSVWNRHPTKVEYVKSKRFLIPNPRKKGKREIWGCKCEICNKVYPQKGVQVDHIEGAGSLNEAEDIQGFMERLAIVDFSGVQILCKECHSYKTHAERSGVSFEESRREAPLRKFLALPAAKQKLFLTKNGVSRGAMNNEKVREASYRKCCM